VAPKKTPGGAQDDIGEGDEPGDDLAQRFAAGPGLRIDKWLWCARFFKTRGLARDAVDGGRVQLNGDRVKASRSVRIGDRLRINRERELYEIDVTGIPKRRGPGAEARLHYRETPESEAARAHVRELNRLSGPVSDGRPDKRERRDLMRFVQGYGRHVDDDHAHADDDDDDGDGAADDNDDGVTDAKQ
jgi:ribosome-associated heat shock protein Hsp15